MASENTGKTLSRQDIDFNLFEVLDVGALSQRSLYAEHDREIFGAVLDTAESLAGSHFQSFYRKSDTEEPVLNNGRVETPPELAAALAAFTEAGFMAAHAPQEEGGQQLPVSVVQAAYSFFQAANIGASIYYFLTVSAGNVIRAFGNAEQKARFLEPMLEGRFLGTMCLSEPQAGSGLADIRSRATAQPDGSYRLKGNKMWISAGDHEISENIVHLVLARIEGAPAGVKGISLFIVPKHLVGPDGKPGARNDVRVMGLNHKMGYRGAVNSLLSFGEADDCTAYLIGEPHRGLDYMFVMMNEARISVGLGATMLGYAGYLHSLEYAKQRVQGRLPDNKDPASPPVPIIQHGDVRRMLLLQKCYVEGALALGLYAAYLVDEERTSPDAGIQAEASLLLEMLTPIVKSWPSEYCLEANKLAIQVLGGYGYTRDFPVEQYYRDNRLNLIHEGTNGIQAIDFVGRKIRMREGAGLALLAERMEQDINNAKAPALAEFAAQLRKDRDRVIAATKSIVGDAKPGQMGRYLANASSCLDMYGHLVIAWMWLRQATAAQRRLDIGNAGAAEAFLQGKLAACRFFFRHELKRLDHWLPIVAAQDATVLETNPDWL
ncbi:acyl-CoA dehydrogenase [Ferrovibrio sp.]|uniref:acyl-CoA dehydrogenase n=1 Tax=Ferrovibrio sp. TaxID=1917215 RepID=UPI0035B0191C